MERQSEPPLEFMWSNSIIHVCVKIKILYQFMDKRLMTEFAIIKINILRTTYCMWFSLCVCENRLFSTTQVYVIVRWSSSDSAALTEQLINICKNFKVSKHLLNINYLRGGEAEAQFPKEHRSDEHHLKQNEKHSRQNQLNKQIPTITPGPTHSKHRGSAQIRNPALYMNI